MLKISFIRTRQGIFDYCTPHVQCIHAYAMSVCLTERLRLKTTDAFD